MSNATEQEVGKDGIPPKDLFPFCCPQSSEKPRDALWEAMTLGPAQKLDTIWKAGRTQAFSPLIYCNGQF